MFEIAGSENSELFAFGYGGFQGGRGANTGGNFFVENLFEVGDLLQFLSVDPAFMFFFWEDRESIEFPVSFSS
jgi:hypothetical protein